MKLLNLLALALLTLSVYAADVSVKAEVITATDVTAKVKVTVINNATPTTMSVTATVNYQRWGLDEEVASIPLTISVMHPVVVRSINLSFPNDWLLLTPFTPTTVLDGQTLELTLEYGKIQVIL
jgi:hypothetical protein